MARKALIKITIMRKLISDLRLRLFGFKCRPKYPLRPNRTTYSVYPEGWPLTPEQIVRNIYEQLTTRR
jgi:hypothetical protein